MKKNDISSIAGLLATTALAVVSGGIINPAATSILGGIASAGGNIGASLAANFITKFTPDKMRNWFKNVHPNHLNHHVKKLFIKSVSEALQNVYVLFSETKNSDQEKNTAKQLIKILQKHVPDMLLDDTQIRLEENEIKHFLYEENREKTIYHFIETQLTDFEITDSFKKFLAQNLPGQIQLCFGEGLKDPANHNAWVAFQRMLVEEIRYDIKQIADTQNSIKEDLSDLKFEKSGFSEEQLNEIHELIKILNDKKIVEVKIKGGINQSLESIEAKANSIIQITTETKITVAQLKMNIEKINRQNKINHTVIFFLSGCLLIAGLFIVYKLMNQPFTATIQVCGWENSPHNPLNGKGTLVLTLGDKIEKAEINRQGEAIFKDILPKYNGKTVSVYITEVENEPYYLTDSVIQISKGKKSEIQVRLQGLEKFEGVIVDENGVGIAGATVIVAGMKDKTDERGYFNMAIPTDKQQHTQEVEIFKEGYTPYRNIAMPMTNEVCRIILPFKN
jgi:hypothetical protein